MRDYIYEQMSQTVIYKLSDSQLLEFVSRDGTNKLIVDGLQKIIKFLEVMELVELRGSHFYNEISTSRYIILASLRNNISTLSYELHSEELIGSIDEKLIIDSNLGSFKLTSLRTVFSLLEHVTRKTDKFINCFTTLNPRKIIPNDLKGLKDLLEDVPAFNEIWTKCFNYYQASGNEKTGGAKLHELSVCIVKTFAQLHKPLGST